MAKTLIVWVPGLRLGVKSGKELLDLLCSEPELQGAEVFSWDHKAGYLSTKYAELLGQGLSSAIEGQWEDAVRRGITYEKIILIGHSIGAVLIRHAYLIGLGSYVRNLPAKPWALTVSRIVLLAGINRGLFPPEDPGVRRAPYRIRRWLGRHVIELASQIPILHLLAEDILAGSDFVTNLRLWWIRRFDGMKNPPTVLQLVGTEDGIVRHSDSLDIEQDRAGNQIVIDQADHASIICVRDKNGNLLKGRYALIRKAVLDVFPATPSPVPEEEWARPVVFVVHGIRASNHGWVDEAGEQIHSHLNNARVVKATYWYFSALDFLIPILRKRKLRWFKDTYSYYLARSPKADFHFLGHSNGTYLLGQSLLSLSGMEFKRVVLAGSVLPRNFAWQIAAQRSQISQIWNHRATSDFPVAVLCNALRGLRMRDVGTGGFDGFQVLPQICECYYHPGGHSAALTKESLNVLAAQVAGATGVVCPHQQLVPTPPRWFERVSAMAALLPWIVLILIVAVSWIFGGILASHMPGGMVGARLLVAATLLIATGILLKFL